MAIHCLFCRQDVTADGGQGFKPSRTLYMCKRCGHIYLTEEAAEDFESMRYSSDQKASMSIILRNEWEASGRRPRSIKIMSSNLAKIASDYRPLDPIEKMNYALLKFEKISKFVGAQFTVDAGIDYPIYHCKEPGEIRAICRMLQDEGYTSAPDPVNPQNNLHITAKGYQLLRELQKPNIDSRQCFVAMWFTEEMNDVYERAIKPAIEFIEEGKSKPRFEAIKIDNVEHTNDINDEIIAQIRRSRFLVCDLSGYRGGVYFEAGFAYGLGLEVIYTCRKDWTKEEILKDEKGQEIKQLYDSAGSIIKIKKEAVHFDLAHRNRIEWDPANMEDFKKKLEARIKAVII